MLSRVEALNMVVKKEKKEAKKTKKQAKPQKVVKAKAVKPAALAEKVKVPKTEFILLDIVI